MATKTQGERMVAMETDIQYIKKATDKLIDKMDDHLKESLCYRKEVDDRFDNLIKVFSAKWVEKAAWAFIGMIFTGLVVIIAGQIFGGLI